VNAQAVIFTAPNTVEVQPVTCPDPGPEDVVVRVTPSWISNGTEGSFLRGERIAGDTAYRPGDPWPFPIVAGYQKIGVVEWVGSGVDDIVVGETVFAALGKVDGMFTPLGGQLSPSVSPRRQLWKLPAGVEPLAFAGLVLTQVGYNCGSRAPIEIGQGAVVFGDGMVGQWAAQTLAWRGATVVLVGRHDDRLAKFGPSPLHHTVNAQQVEWRQEVKRLLPGGVQVAVDTVGSIAAIEQVMPQMVRNGHIVSAGFYGTADLLSLQPLRNGELSIDLVSGWTQERMDQTLALIAGGQLQTLPLITHHFPVAQAAKAWELIESKREPVLGVILDWSAAAQ
jgi:2-desacetyl-2-hydroxyethyl bacteriochlorophyllide A dehydrogenase